MEESKKNRVENDVCDVIVCDEMRRMVWWANTVVPIMVKMAKQK